MEVRPKGEGSSFSVKCGFLNYLDQATTMIAVKYRIDCLTTGQTVRDWTSVTPSAAMEIAVAPADCVILNDRNKRERRQLTIVANDDGDTQFVDPDPLLWWVNNTLPGRSVIP
jgi:hypothetical protein